MVQKVMHTFITVDPLICQALVYQYSREMQFRQN